MKPKTKRRVKLTKKDAVHYAMFRCFMRLGVSDAYLQATELQNELNKSAYSLPKLIRKLTPKK